MYQGVSGAAERRSREAQGAARQLLLAFVLLGGERKLAHGQLKRCGHGAQSAPRRIGLAQLQPRKRPDGEAGIDREDFPRDSAGFP